MKHPAVRFVLASIAVFGVIVMLKIVGMSPNHVFRPHDNVDFGPFGHVNMGSDGDSWLSPLLLVHVLAVPAVWHICRRAGYSSWFSLAMLVPLANVALLYFLAFAEWPNQPRDDRSPAPFESGDSLVKEKPTPSRPSDDIRI